MANRIEIAKQKIKERVDRILDVVPMRDFVELVTVTGGDCVVFRVYDDGSVVER